MTQAAKPLPETVLSVSGLTLVARSEAGEKVLVDDLSFTLARGETLALAGESGSGKSLTSLAIMGLLPGAVYARSGAVRLGETDLLKLPEAQMRAVRGDRVAMIFQEPMTSLNPVMTVGAQLSEAIRAHEAVSPAQAAQEALAALKAVRLSQPERRMRQYPHELSGGMRQRVMIAMALALKPDVMIADEPTTALDVTVQREVLDLLRDLQAATGMGLILITHDMGVVAEMADRVIILRHGKQVETGPIRQIFAAPQAAYTQDLLAAVPRMGAGRGRPLPEGEVLARLQDVSVRFPLRGGVLGRVTQNVHAVERVSFDIRAHETLALVGESGCGKSSVARALVGLVPHEGRIEIAGRVLAGMSAAERKAHARDVQVVFQDPMAALNPRLTVGALVQEPLDIHALGTVEQRRAKVADLFLRVGLTHEQMARYPHELSGGQRQRVCIARALALQPKLIIADESVSALDVSVQARVLDLLTALKREFGIAYLFISHDMAVVENIADRVGVMYLGQIVEFGTRDQVFTDPRHPYTRRLLEAVPVPDPTHARPQGVRMAGEIPSPVHAVGSGPQRVVLRDVGAGHLVADHAQS